MRTKAAEDLADEGDVAGAAIVQARNKFLTQVIYKLRAMSRKWFGKEMPFRQFPLSLWAIFPTEHWYNISGLD